MSDLSELQTAILADIASASDEAALEAVRVATLGKKGSVSALLSGLGKMTPEERKTEGAAINALKDSVNAALVARRAILKEAALEARLKTETVDVTLPVRARGLAQGRIHPVTQVTDELAAIFADMGFSIAEGPDIESDDYNFTKLNFPPDHPARDMHDTFFLNPGPDGERKVLRTHTSPVQVRTMLSQKPPIRVICPGRTYRCDLDQTHTPMFHQVEGLVIDRSAKSWPSEMDSRRVSESVVRSGGREDPLSAELFSVHRTLRRSRCSMLAERRRNPLRRGRGLARNRRLRHGASECFEELRPRPGCLSGVCLGVGIDRLAMLKYGMSDLRPFFEADVRWLKHYGFRPLDLPNLVGGLSA